MDMHGCMCATECPVVGTHACLCHYMPILYVPKDATNAEFCAPEFPIDPEGAMGSVTETWSSTATVPERRLGGQGLAWSILLRLTMGLPQPRPLLESLVQPLSVL